MVPGVPRRRSAAATSSGQLRDVQVRRRDDHPAHDHVPGPDVQRGVPATADIKWNLCKFGYEWDFVSRERGFFGLIADLKYNKVVASIDSPVLTSAATTDITAPVPTFGVIGRGYIAPNVSITGEFTGLNQPGEDSR